MADDLPDLRASQRIAIAWIEPRSQMCRVTLDFTQAVITSNALQIEANMVPGELFLITGPGMVIDADGLTLTYSKVELRSRKHTSDPDLPIGLVGPRWQDSSSPECGSATSTCPGARCPTHRIQ